MALKTWTFGMGGKQYSVKAKKDEVEALQSALRSLIGIRQHQRELMGVLGNHNPDDRNREHESKVWIMFGESKGVMPDEAGYQAEKDALFQKMDAMGVVQQADLYDLVKEAKDILNRHMPVLDNRKTEMEADLRELKSIAATMKFDAERKAADAEFFDRFAEPGEEIAWGAGQMAVLLKMTYDDSNVMVDYFHPHAGWGHELLLAIVPSGARTEAVARAAVARFGSLAGLTFAWHTENYSGGHGNYLISQTAHQIASNIAEEQANGQDWGNDHNSRSAYWHAAYNDAIAGLDPETYVTDVATGRTSYGGNVEPVLCYEITFQPYAGKARAYKGYGTAPVAETSAVGVDGFEITEDWHAKHKKKMWLVKPSAHVSRDTYDRYASVARRFGVRWSNWGAKSKRGWIFFDQARAQAFATEAARA